ncbi:MAG: hypothetical protein M3365_09910, partial [Gemmatimonadota bacterium]|nr:hypothetical protein [Gemmatimonadota bacterium]
MKSPHARSLYLMFVALLIGCAAPAVRSPQQDGPDLRSSPASTQAAFWSALQSLCGRAYAGTMVEGNASDSTFRTSELRMHVRSCAPDEIRIPFHLGANR